MLDEGPSSLSRSVRGLDRRTPRGKHHCDTSARQSRIAIASNFPVDLTLFARLLQGILCTTGVSRFAAVPRSDRSWACSTDVRREQHLGSGRRLLRRQGSHGPHHLDDSKLLTCALAKVGHNDGNIDVVRVTGFFSGKTFAPKTRHPQQAAENLKLHVKCVTKAHGHRTPTAAQAVSSTVCSRLSSNCVRRCAENELIPTKIRTQAQTLRHHTAARLDMMFITEVRGPNWLEGKNLHMACVD